MTGAAKGKALPHSPIWEMILTTPIGRTFDNIVATFPSLGPHGAKPEADTALIELGEKYDFLDKAFGDTLMLAALKEWSTENTDMMRLLDMRLSMNNAEARKKFIADRVNKLKSYGINQKDIDIIAEKWADKKISALDLMLESTHNFADIGDIYRGSAMYSNEFARQFQVGKKITWNKLMACTLSSDFVPIHYAWKQRNERVKSIHSTEVTSFILHIRLKKPPVLLWTGAVKGEHRATTYRWQLEVVTQPGFEFEVRSLTTINKNPQDRLVLVEAVYAP